MDYLKHSAPRVEILAITKKVHLLRGSFLVKISNIFTAGLQTCSPFLHTEMVSPSVTPSKIPG